jgi:hypothetical protein
MHNAVQELRIRAELLHHRAKSNDDVTLRRFSKLGLLNSGDIRRRQCLEVIAIELGFANWPQAKRVLSGEPVTDYGTLLYPNRCAAHLNLWYREHEEASVVREARQGYLLAYRRVFVVVDRYFIESLGLEPEDAAWEPLHFDWTSDDQGCGEARATMYAKLVATLPPEGPSGIDV